MAQNHTINQGPRDSQAPVDDALPLRKRRRLTTEHADIHHRSADRETALEVDIMILDYQAYQTTMAVLNSRYHNEQQALDSHLVMTDAFLSVFKTQHPTYHADAELRFRLSLLQFATLYTQRVTQNESTPSTTALRTLREDNRRRARRWIGCRERVPSMNHDTTKFEQELPIAQECMEVNRAHVLRILGAPAEDEHYEDAFYGTSACVSLLDTLPLFMQMCATVNAIQDSSLTSSTIKLFGDLMLQACLEQYLVYGAEGADVVDEAFAWGTITASDAQATAEEEGDGARALLEVHRMFADDSQLAGLVSWEAVKQDCLDRLILAPAHDPHVQTPLLAHLEGVAAEYPIREFDATLREYLLALAAAVPEPILTQLERGSLNGMSEEETKAFLRSCGVGDTFVIPQ